MIGVYAIKHKTSGKVYVGKSIDIEHRFWSHKNSLSKPVRSKDVNRHLYNAVQKYGIDDFEFQVLEVFDKVVEGLLSDAELKWMDRLNSCDREHGYNLRRDSSSQSFVHEETRVLLSEIYKGERNPNFNNKWSEEAKASMSEKIKAKHAQGSNYNDQWKHRIGKASSEQWKDENKRLEMAKKVKVARRRFVYFQFTKDGQFIAEWDNLDDVLKTMPFLKIPNLYGACDGYKPTHGGFVWRKMPRGHKEKESFIRDLSESIRKKNFHPFYAYEKYSLTGEFICRYESFEDLKVDLPQITPQGLWLSCSDFKRSSRGFRWKKVVK